MYEPCVTGLIQSSASSVDFATGKYVPNTCSMYAWPSCFVVFLGPVPRYPPLGGRRSTEPPLVPGTYLQGASSDPPSPPPSPQEGQYSPIGRTTFLGVPGADVGPDVTPTFHAERRARTPASTPTSSPAILRDGFIPPLGVFIPGPRLSFFVCKPAVMNVSESLHEIFPPKEPVGRKGAHRGIVNPRSPSTRSNQDGIRYPKGDRFSSRVDCTYVRVCTTAVQYSVVRFHFELVHQVLTGL